MATVEFTKEAAKQAERLPATMLERVRKVILRLEKWPAVSGAKPLTANLAGSYRMRVGDYRLRFYVRGERVIVDKVGHRSEFYDD